MNYYLGVTSPANEHEVDLNLPCLVKISSHSESKFLSLNVKSTPLPVMSSFSLITEPDPLEDTHNISLDVLALHHKYSIQPMRLLATNI